MNVTAGGSVRLPTCPTAPGGTVSRATRRVVPEGTERSEALDSGPQVLHPPLPDSAKTLIGQPRACGTHPATCRIDTCGAGGAAPAERLWRCGPPPTPPTTGLRRRL